MKIRVTYYGQARQITGKEQESLSIDENASVVDVCRQVAGQYGDDASRLLLTEDSKSRRSVLLAVNDEVVDPEASGTLSEGDEVSVFPAMSGG